MHGVVGRIQQKAADILVREHPGLRVAGCHSPPFGFERDPDKDAAVVELVKAA